MDEKSVGKPEVKNRRRAELWISWVLRLGVGISLILISAGIVACFFHHPQYFSSPMELNHLIAPGAIFPRTLPEVFHEVLDCRGMAIVSVGLLLLIATPIARVAISLAGFIEDKDYVFACITSAVLIILLLSFLLGNVQ
jgi:uncharacterized membrane protein